jgi:hypothetical protein
MSKQIWKFNININVDVLEIKMPKDAKILSIQMQNNTPFIWAIVNTENSTESRYFELFATGQNIDEDIKRNYIGTIQFNGSMPLVFHLFERTLPWQ